MTTQQPAVWRTLYRPETEHDACGVGFIADVSGHRSHAILEQAILAVTHLAHRGAVAADRKTGDGAGILAQLPYELFVPALSRAGLFLADPRDLAVGMIFFPGDDRAAERECRATVEAVVARFGLRLLTWRPVPVDPEALGERARRTMPRIEQVLVGRTGAIPREEFERTVYLARKEIERRILETGIETFYIPSFSSRTIVYKGLFVSTQLAPFYADLRDPAFKTALAVFHQRYSTNTFPDWFRAQPFRFLAHNGEINTIQGNRNWMTAREAELEASRWGKRAAHLKPVIQPGGSDSASLDNALELLVQSGRDVLHAMTMLIPEAWENMPDLDEARRAFYQYHACLTEPWDGPAGVAFTDGAIAGATLDRNGLRPQRYYLTADGRLLVGSEVGMLEVDEREVVQKGRLGPGQMIAVDTRRGRLLTNDEIKSELAGRRPWGEWVKRQLRRLPPVAPVAPVAPAAPGASGASVAPVAPVVADGHGRPAAGGGGGSPAAVHLPETQPGFRRLQKAFGYTTDELEYMVKPMLEGKEPTGSMGDDTPLAVLSRYPRLLYGYFRQRFAQVTNPPIDPLREHNVMSLQMYLGTSGNLLEEGAGTWRLLKLDSPILTDAQLAALRNLPDPELRPTTLPAVFEVAGGAAALEEALDALCATAEHAVRQGAVILILSDRPVDAGRAPIPMLLAVGAVHHHLIRAGLRMRTSLVVETGEAREVHQVACLIGYGASAVNPYLALATVRAICAEEGLDVPKATANFVKALEKGLLKVMSKMGISTLNSYHGAQIFEAIGLSETLIERCFTGTASQIGGIGLAEIARDAALRHAAGFGPDATDQLEDSGYFRYRKGGEQHAFAPTVVKALHKATMKGGGYEAYRLYAKEVNEREPVALRDLLRFKPAGPPLPLEEVESVESIRRRFTTQGMSLGALSPEMHQTLAEAMNAIGGKSNSGEGGEAPERYRDPMRTSRIKQVASARFGVTTEYLVNADELEIKMAQGSKPGEGGQLPGFKVAPHIARLRHSTPGITLISPPPHHDIYSIEDLAQLIYDLKQVNPTAKVCVKLVAVHGVGTIAAGVAKAYADVILISGHDGGTGASPLSSIKNAGSPWELGIAEAHQVLVRNDLRGRVVLRADGGMKTGRDVVVAAMLGADAFGFGTAPLVAAGCVMARQCHTNTCPVGIATQREDLRAKFPGKPQHVIDFFTFVAMEVREILASLGVRSLDEVIGRTDLLEPVPAAELPPGHEKAATLDLRAMLAPADPTGTKPTRNVEPRNDRPGDRPLDLDLLPALLPALERGEPVRLASPIRNVHRTVGARIAGEVARRWGNYGLPEGTIEIRFTGHAGQSFGAFTCGGMRLVLEGDANDYVGKGMTAGEIVLYPPRERRYAAHENIIMGNTVLYGATGGRLFAAGRAGERFAVRNSGARAVVEGVGDHGCEYMTGGLVLVLGRTGRNFGAGMSGGLAYVLDEDGDFERKVNPEMVTPQRVVAEADLADIRALVEAHLAATGSERAAAILARWDDYAGRFVKVVPKPPAVVEAAGEKPVARPAAVA
ncbi:MAG TPA: glutamate synthase large subunit [Thermodesulfobacteriota bacterium]|nr:glutamate synthase large subunit [Thermodesulfobacteriota bacterium]